MSSKSFTAFVGRAVCLAQSRDVTRSVSAHDTMEAAAKVFKRGDKYRMFNLPAASGDNDNPQDPATASKIQLVGKFWSMAAEELVPIRDDLAEMYRDAGAAGIMEYRALSMGVMVGYLESLMAKQPSRIAELGSLYGRLVESERRAYEAHRKHRKVKDTNPDLARMA